MERDELLCQAIAGLEDAFIGIVQGDEAPDIKSVKEYLGMAKTIKELRDLLSPSRSELTVRFEEHGDWAG